MPEVTLKKQMKMVELYLSGLSYNEIMRRVGVGKGSVVKVIDDLKGGRYAEVTDVAGQVDALRETAVRLNKEGMMPTKAALGLAVWGGINSMGVSPEEVPKAIVLTRADRARDLKPKPAYLAGYGQRMTYDLDGRIGGTLMDYMEAGRSSAKLTWERSGFGPKDVDVAQVYDGFSFRCIAGLESYGFCGQGEALDFIQDGRIELDGELPLNTFGGVLSSGRLHGLSHVIEGVMQATGRAGERQVRNVKVSFVSSAPFADGSTFIFVPEPY